MANTNRSYSRYDWSFTPEDNLLGRYEYFFHYCFVLITNNPPRIAVPFIAEAIDELATHIERHKKARKDLLERGRKLHEKTLNPRG